MSHAKKRQRTIKQIIFLLLFVPLFSYGIYFLIDRQNKSEMLKVYFVNPDNSKTSAYFLEIADTPQERSKGLMYRQSLPRDQGMFFKFEAEKIQTFHMKNTYLALDMLFLDKDLKVVGLLENLPTLNEVTRKVDKPSKFVVELNAGEVQKSKISIGSKLLE